jgi:serine/threonine protein kinase
MRTCLVCKSTHPDDVDVCPVDGSELDARADRLDATASIAPPSGALLPFASPFASIDEAPVVPPPGPRKARGSLAQIAVEADNEKTRQDRPPRRPPGRPSQTHAAAAAGRSQTSELERQDFSMLLSSEPGQPELVAPESRIGKVYGSYRLTEVIGRGGMGCVYRAEHVKLGRDVALKLLREDYAQRRDAVTRFFQEARAVNLIRHRNIVDVIDYVELGDGIVFIIMELLAGHSLSRLMRAPVDMARALGIAAQICDGLSAAHAVGIVHRDLKPDNIIVVRSPEGGDLVKILDFGVAKLVDKYAADRDLTAAGAVIGTPAFMSPEQAGGLSADARADVYSLGAIMYELFTREPLFRCASFGEFVRKHLNDRPVPPSALPGCEEFDPALEAIILRCLDKSPTARFQSALELRASLLQLADANAARQSAPDAPAPRRSSPAVTAQPRPTPVPVPAAAASASPSPSPVPPVVPLLPVLRVPDPTGETVTSPRFGARSQQYDSMVESDPIGLPAGTREPARGARDSSERGAQRIEHDWTDTPLPGPVPFGTPDPYTAPRTALRPELPAPAEIQSALRDLVPPRRAAWPRKVLAVAVVLMVAGIAFLIPLLAQRAEDQAVSEASAPAASLAESSAPAARASSPAPVPIVTPVAPEDADFDAPPPPRETTEDSAADDDERSSPRSADRSRRAGSSSGSTSGERAPAPIRVRVVSTPPGELHAAGRRGALCETPCALNINPGDGGSARERIYIIKRRGYRDETIAIDLTDPPRQLRVDLQRLRPAGRDKLEDQDGSSETEAAGQSGERGEDGEDGKSEESDESDEERGAKDGADPDSTFNPFSESESP